MDLWSYRHLMEYSPEIITEIMNSIYLLEQISDDLILILHSIILK